MRIAVWFIEFLKVIGRRRLHPLNAECPICHQMVRLHYNKAGRRHLLVHARTYSRALYEGSRYSAHYAADLKKASFATRSLRKPQKFRICAQVFSYYAERVFYRRPKLS
jgi:hypothetical protein